MTNSKPTDLEAELDIIISDICCMPVDCSADRLCADCVGDKKRLKALIAYRKGYNQAITDMRRNLKGE